MQYYIELKEFLDGRETVEVNNGVISRDAQAFKRLVKSLDIAAMTAYDLKMHDLVADLESKRDAAQEQLKQC